jgi:hypothetical protein
MVLFRPEQCQGVGREVLAGDLSRIVGLEVKKLERTAQGAVARASGLDYNTTPPCGRIRVYDAGGAPLDIRGFYLFVCREAARARSPDYVLTALALVDGQLLNADFDFYLSIVGERLKKIGLGTYGDGADRARPMLIFGNPLGVPQLDRRATLVHPSAKLGQDVPGIRLVHRIRRTRAGGRKEVLYGYRLASDVPRGWTIATLADPFPTPEREEQTRPRGRFKLSFRV